jgi:hypothetical protein
MPLSPSRLALTFSFMAAACGGPSTQQPGDDMQPDAAMADSGGCASSAQCPATAPVCTPSGVCVECESSAHCPSERPVCSNQTCVASCASSSVSADFVTLPSDIIFVVDQSGSMDQETQYVQQKINDFVALISATNIDYRVVMIATTSGENAICVPGPLAGASCGNNTRFRLVNQRVGSHDGPSLAISRYSMYSDFLRQTAQKHFVFVTDDNSNMSAASFTSGVNALQPAGMFTGFKVHGIYAYGSGNNGCTGTFGNGAANGTVYTTLVTQTGGARGVICTGDWTQVFNDITAAVVAGSQVSCQIQVPVPTNGESLDPSKVNVRYLSAGVAPGELLPQVSTEAACTAAGGWYYDDNAAPTTINLCPATCTDVQADEQANIQVELGCSTVIL